MTDSARNCLLTRMLCGGAIPNRWVWRNAKVPPTECQHVTEEVNTDMELCARQGLAWN
jgi:hypothetical protein